MAEIDEEFGSLMGRVLAHSEDAARELLKRYEPYLLRAIRRKLNKKMRPKFDSLDFAQEVWASFFTTLPEKQAFKTPDDLAAYLTKVAENKVIESVRQRMKLQKYNVNRETSLNDSKNFNKEILVGRQLSPSELALGHEAWNQYLKTQPLTYQRILILLREGKASFQIVEELGVSGRTVRRVADKLKREFGS